MMHKEKPVEKPWGKCPFCGEPNSQSLAYCRRCNYRLPWADSAENFTDARGELIKGDSPHLAEIFPDSRPALPADVPLRKPKRTPCCRFCNKPIEMNMKSCPHCKEWLVLHGPDMDPWAIGYDARDLEKTALKPNQGCFAFCLVLPALIQKLLS